MVAAVEDQQGMITDDELHQLRSKATELLLRQDLHEYIRLYSHFISVHHHYTTNNTPKIRRFLCLALSSRAEALHRIGDLYASLRDCDDVLRIDPTNRRALLCKAKVSLDLDRYSAASACLQSALDASSCDDVRMMLRRCQRLETLSRTGAVDVSEWVLSGFKGEAPELPEYVGPVEIRISKHGGRGLFATKGVDAGTPLFITKALVIGRGILPKDGGNGRLVMWKDVVDRLLNIAMKNPRTLQLLYSLSTGEGGEEKDMAIPDMGLFHPPEEYAESEFLTSETTVDVDRILKVLDVNSVTEESVSAKVLGRNNSGDGFCGVGLWVLLSFLNHSCRPNTRRLHVGDRVVVHASREVRAGEELTLAYFDVLQPLGKRREEGRRWGFECGCERCMFEEKKGEEEVRGMVDETGRVRMEEGVDRRWKGWVRASFWGLYHGGAGRGRKRRVAGGESVVEVGESVVGEVGGDERVLKVVVEEGVRRGTKKGSGCGGEEERVVRMGKGVYGKVVRRREALKALIQGLVEQQT